MLGIDPLEREGKPVRVAFATDFAVGHDVDAGALHVTNRDHRGIVLGLFQEIGRDAPELGRVHTRHATPPKRLAIDQPIRLRITTNHRRRNQMRGIGHEATAAA